MSSTLIYVGLPEDSKSSITKTISTMEMESVDELVSTADMHQDSAVNTCIKLIERGRGEGGGRNPQESHLNTDLGKPVTNVGLQMF
ncbi:unnamed protein product [Leptidea sinapis]|uniref:Uncharacterized protein n=1 Tax=Leptidea sinapis TaxID=189913 RepID=A0A5E4QDR8_9NEOP|nr:unnamed protein product [Leptidea sinapis]